jgi:hypothetical protein
MKLIGGDGGLKSRGKEELDYVQLLKTLIRFYKNLKSLTIYLE